MVDTWLAGIEHDHTARSMAQKVAAHRPTGAVDTCFVQALQVTDKSVCGRVFPYYADPRIAAGGPLTDDVLKCQLRPLRRGDYPSSLDDGLWARLKVAFPSGVCDYSQPGVGRTRTVTWLSFPRPGGVPLGPAPTSTFSPS